MQQADLARQQELTSAEQARARDSAAIAAGVSTATMSAPSMATAPGARTRRVASSVTTVALVTTSATRRFAPPAWAASALATTTLSASAVRLRTDTGAFYMV